MMSEAEESVARSVIGQRPREWTAWQDLRDPRRRRIIGLAGYVGLVSVLFVQTLARLLGLALDNDLHSYIPIVPVISGYLLYIQPKTVVPYRSSIGPTIVLAAVGFSRALNDSLIFLVSLQLQLKTITVRTSRFDLQKSTPLSRNVCARGSSSGACSCSANC